MLNTNSNIKYYSRPIQNSQHSFKAVNLFSGELKLVDHRVPDLRNICMAKCLFIDGLNIRLTNGVLWNITNLQPNMNAKAGSEKKIQYIPIPPKMLIWRCHCSLPSTTQCLTKSQACQQVKNTNLYKYSLWANYTYSTSQIRHDSINSHCHVMSQIHLHPSQQNMSSRVVRIVAHEVPAQVMT